jgi:glycosyltransferase involved in cell wall biosynthesis
MADIARAAGVPLVTSLYGVDAAVLPYLPRWRAGYDRLFQTGALFLAEGPEMRKRIIAAGAPEARTVIQPIAIRLDKYPAWKPTSRSAALFVGRFVEKKGLLDAIAAFARARARVPGATLTIVGGGPEEAAARSAVDRHALAGCVDFAGMRPHADVIERLRRASVLVHPSVTGRDGDSEGGAPTILLEAQAIGTPIVTTRHADIPNVVPPGAGVWLCAEHDADALADALVAAFTQCERSSAAHVTTYHDVARAVVRLEERYDEVTARSSRPAAAMVPA